MVIDVIVNRWWKISAHGSATGGVIALCFRIMNLGAEVNGETMQWVTIGVIIVAGLVGTARLLLERHTLGQVLGGNANGFLCVYFITAIN